jgi:hypothetical protein
MNRQKMLKKALAGPENVRFGDLVALVQAFGFGLERIRGSHLFSQPRIPELLNLQNRKGEAKPCQIRQFLQLLEQYNLSLEEEP